jgi:hypothetical protein
METFDLVEDGRLRCQVELIEAFRDLAVSTLLEGLTCGFELIDKGVDAIRSLEADDDAVEGGRVAGKATNTAGQVYEHFG